VLLHNIINDNDGAGDGCGSGCVLMVMMMMMKICIVIIIGMRAAYSFKPQSDERQKSGDFYRPTKIGRFSCHTTDDFCRPTKSGKWIRRITVRRMKKEQPRLFFCVFIKA